LCHLLTVDNYYFWFIAYINQVYTKERLQTSRTQHWVGWKQYACDTFFQTSFRISVNINICDPKLSTSEKFFYNSLCEVRQLLCVWWQAGRWQCNRNRRICKYDADVTN
jgi:hypothetical protein